MATYLDFYELKHAPFATEGGRLLLGTPALKEALAAIKRGLRNGSPRICLSGGPGVGKTSLARALPRLLGDSVRCILLAAPARPWTDQLRALAAEVGVDPSCLPEGLLDADGSHQRLVVVIDGAETLQKQSLEGLDELLAVNEGLRSPLLHCVLFADLQGASSDGEVPLLWWLDQLTTLQLEFAPIPASGVLEYIDKHLKQAGWDGGTLFTDGAAEAIHHYSGGIPLAISQLCERLLSEAAERGLQRIDQGLVEEVSGERGERSDTRQTDAAAHGSEAPPEAPIRVPIVKRPASAIEPLRPGAVRAARAEEAAARLPATPPPPDAGRRAAQWLGIAGVLAVLGAGAYAWLGLVAPQTVTASPTQAVAAATKPLPRSAREPSAAVVHPRRLQPTTANPRTARQLVTVSREERTTPPDARASTVDPAAAPAMGEEPRGGVPERASPLASARRAGSATSSSQAPGSEPSSVTIQQQIEQAAPPSPVESTAPASPRPL